MAICRYVLELMYECMDRNLYYKFLLADIRLEVWFLYWASLLTHRITSREIWFSVDHCHVTTLPVAVVTGI